jgi:SNF2 family DNA or RNA helicase
LSSGVASIRPASWKSTNDCLDNNIVDLSASASMNAQPKLGTQSYKSSITGETLSQHHTDKTEAAIDRLPPEISYTPDEVKPIQDEYRMILIKNAKLSSPLKNGWLLFPHQKKAIIRALTMRRMILALDMGLGKTLIGAVWSKAFKETFGQDKLKIFVICPVTLKQEWKRTVEGTVGLDVDEEGKSKSKSKKSTKKKRTQQDRSRSELSSESIVEKPETNMKMSICSWAKVPKVVDSNIEHFVVCCDEAHAMQSTQAQRTKDILKLVDDKR